MPAITLKSTLNPFYISVFIALLFHFSGFIGMQTEYRDWFIQMTPLTLILMSTLVFINDKTLSKKALMLYIILGFMTGLIAEIIGVNTGLLFGMYNYGTPFGFKILGVPVLIGLLWVVTVYGIGHLTQWFFDTFLAFNENNYTIKFIKILVAAFMVTAFDVILEPGAIVLGYWQWLPDGEIPFFNYICWFTISGFLLCPFFIYENFYKNTNHFAAILMVIQSIFFIGIKLF